MDFRRGNNFGGFAVESGEGVFLKSEGKTYFAIGTDARMPSGEGLILYLHKDLGPLTNESIDQALAASQGPWVKEDAQVLAQLIKNELTSVNEWLSARSRRQRNKGKVIGSIKQ